MLYIFLIGFWLVEAISMGFPSLCWSPDTFPGSSVSSLPATGRSSPSPLPLCPSCSPGSRTCSLTVSTASPSWGWWCYLPVPGYSIWISLGKGDLGGWCRSRTASQPISITWRPTGRLPWGLTPLPQCLWPMALAPPYLPWSSRSPSW